VPNAFTPNGDGINDVFRVEGEGITELQLSIFNRWGELIFDGEELERGWDGDYHEIHVQDGVYVWKVHYRTIGQKGWQQATGHVTVLR
jgi:gliding motility-associated-like protein